MADGRHDGRLALLTVLFVGLVVWLVVRYTGPQSAVEDTDAARRILAERYACGEKHFAGLFITRAAHRER